MINTFFKTINQIADNVMCCVTTINSLFAGEHLSYKMSHKYKLYKESFFDA